MRKIDRNPTSCAVTRTVSYIGGKWKPIILLLLSEGPVRFGRLNFVIGAISRKILTQELRELEEDGLISRHAYLEKPPRVEYELTERGERVLPILEAMRVFGNTVEDIHPRETKSLRKSNTKAPQTPEIEVTA